MRTADRRDAQQMPNDPPLSRGTVPAAGAVAPAPVDDASARPRPTAWARVLGLTLAGALAAACDAGPLAVDDAPRAAAQGAGVEKAAISGTIQFLGIAAPPARTLVTPSGRCHIWGLPVVTTFTGDVAGVVTFYEQQHGPCDLSRVVASGPFQGTVTWNGRTGTITGQWTTNCKPDASQPLGLSCGGTTNARGSGGLEGVRFHYGWGPGWYPFTYTGTAFSR